MKQVPMRVGTFRCAYSGKNYPTSDLAELTDRKYYPIAKTQAAQNFHRCERCKSYYQSGCTCTSKPANPELMNWNSSIQYKAFKKNNLPSIGIEIEMGAGSGSWRSTQYIKNIYKLPYVIFKYDGSIGGGSINRDNALELVTLPINVGEVDNLELWDLLLPVIRYGGVSRMSETCGLHIHLSKTMFTTSGLFNYLRFHRDYFPLIVLLSGRTMRRIERWADPKPILSATDSSLTKISEDMISTWDRHNLISLAHSRSIEMRYFAGNLNPEIIRRNIEFCVSLAQYCCELADSAPPTDDGYIEYLHNHKMDYPRIENFFSDTELRVED